MSVSVSYPGVYVEEFTPGAPIAGVGTSVAGFVGTAPKGPIATPTRVQSWDAFVATFGGFPQVGPPSWLACGVYGYFLNGGTDCYVLRVATGRPAETNLDSRVPGLPAPALVVEARNEGVAGNAVTVQAADSSRLATQLRQAGAGAPGPGGPAAATTLVLHRSETSVTAQPDANTITAASSAGFAAGDSILLSPPQGVTETPIPAMVRAVASADTIRLVAPLPTGAGVTNWSVRTGDVVPGQTVLRVDVPTGLTLSQALPGGSTVALTSGQTSEVATVAAAGGDTVALAAPLTNRFPLDPGAPPVTLASLEFDLVVTDSATGASETFAELSTNARHPAYVGTAVRSALVTVRAPDAAAPAVDARPKPGTYPLTGGAEDDRAAAWAQLQNDPAAQLDRLRPFGEISLVSVPGAVDAGTQQAVVAHCESTFSRFAVLDAAPGLDPDGSRAQLAQVRSAQGFAALYYPWISVRDPRTGALSMWPPSGHVTGAFAQTDATRGVHKAPANVALRGALGVERRLTDTEQGPLNLDGVNVIRVFPGQAQPLVWGARTTAGSLDRNWQYVNVRRLFLFLEQSIQQGIRWAVFEPNDLGLWQRLKRTIGEFLTRVWRDGALFGATAEEAFYVRIDEALNPPSTRALGELHIEVGVQPAYPAEFLVLRIGIWQGGSSVTEQ